MSEEKTKPTNVKEQIRQAKESKLLSSPPLAMSDIAWAGRLFSKYPWWIQKVSSFIGACSLVSLLCLLAIGVSISLRKPSLLLGVYPDGQLVCFPSLKTQKGQTTKPDPSYDLLCQSLAKRSGHEWQSQETNRPTDQAAVGTTTPPVYTSLEQVWLSAHQPNPQPPANTPLPGATP